MPQQFQKQWQNTILLLYFWEWYRFSFVTLDSLFEICSIQERLVKFCSSLFIKAVANLPSISIKGMQQLLSICPISVGSCCPHNFSQNSFCPMSFCQGNCHLSAYPHPLASPTKQQQQQCCSHKNTLRPCNPENLPTMLNFSLKVYLSQSSQTQGMY